LPSLADPLCSSSNFGFTPDCGPRSRDLTYLTATSHCLSRSGPLVTFLKGKVVAPGFSVFAVLTPSQSNSSLASDYWSTRKFTCTLADVQAFLTAGQTLDGRKTIIFGVKVRDRPRGVSAGVKTSVNHPADWSSRGTKSLYHAVETDLSSFLHEISVLSIDENAHSSDPLSPVSR